MRFYEVSCITLSLLIISGSALGSDKGIQTSGIYLAIGGGADIQLKGLDDGLYPALEAGFGYSWSSFSVEVDLFWNMTDWDSPVPMTDPIMPLIGGATYTGHVLGAILYGSFFPVKRSFGWNHYIKIGIGGEAILTEESIRPEFYTPCEESFTMGGLVARGGAGTEINVSESISLGLTLMYSYTRLFNGIECHPPDDVETPANVHSVNLIVSMRLSI